MYCHKFVYLFTKYVTYTLDYDGIGQNILMHSFKSVKWIEIKISIIIPPPHLLHRRHHHHMSPVKLLQSA